MRKLQAALTLTAVLVYANESLANPLSEAGRTARNADSVHSFESVFKDLSRGQQILIKDTYKSAPPEMQSAIANNYRTYGEKSYFQIKKAVEGDAITAVTLAPNSSTDLKRATVTQIHSENGKSATSEFTVAGSGNPKSISLPSIRDYQENLIINEPMGIPVGGFTGNHIGHYSTDTISGVPVSFRTRTDNAYLKETNVYAVMKHGNEDRRFTLQAHLTSDPILEEGMERGRWVKEADGSREYYTNPDHLDVDVRVKRKSPNGMLDGLDIAVNFREMRGHTTLYYELPKRADGVLRQVQDIKLKTDPKTNAITMEVIATDGEVLTFKIEREGDRAKLTKVGQPRTLESMAEYSARHRTIQGRQIVDADGAGGKGLEVEAGR